jgi:BirA family transcriptional regulator, biotin operon repressor / biotin---[acetyl-CoA-carboxylase] ligase
MTTPERLRPRPGSGALGGPLVHLDTTGSTNDRARTLALAGAPGGTVVLAEEQTAGRGRQGRSWTAPRGRALTLSALWNIDRHLEMLPLAVALAVCEACESVTAVLCRIKWPNDVWVGTRKLAGILIETRPRDHWAVIGIGLNVDTDRQELEPRLRETATSLRIETGAQVDRNQTLAALLDALGARLGELENKGTAGLLAAYRERDLLRGRRISWSAGSGTLPGEQAIQSGEAHGIDERGNLIVFLGDGQRLALSAGEVHLEVEAQ